MKNWKINYRILFVFWAMLFALNGYGQAASEFTHSTESASDWLSYIFITVAILLLVTILVVVNVLKGLSGTVLAATKKNVAALVGILMLFSHVALAAEPAGKGHELSSILRYTLFAVVIIVELLTLAYLLKNVRIFLNILSPVRKQEVVSERGLTWDAIWQKINGLKPIEKEVDLRMKDHVYDGNIVELDNRMPPWLFFMFSSTIIFAFVYIYLYHFTGWGPNPKQEYEIAMAEAAVSKAVYLDKQANTIDENSVALLTDAASLEAGATIYKVNCVACHGDKGQGGVGPNITDDYWIHGGAMTSLYKTITYGVEAKGMKSWKNDIMPADIQKVASYIKSMRGTNPPGAKAPQGERYTEEHSTGSSASTSAVETKPATNTK
ncbi:MAG: hypothetical protein RLZZ161_215 [Bacteroidota bacterium]|jgi:cytochrome c oxidase cbb3-type subunit 3